MEKKALRQILVVDDNITNLKYLQEQLKGEYRVSMAKSGELALEFLVRTIPDLILLDVVMPDMDGFETYERILMNPYTKDIPVIFLTASGDTESELRGFRMGAMDFIRKPFEYDIMRSRISRIMELSDLKHDLEYQVNKKTEETERVTVMSISAIASLIDAKDIHTKGHAIRVALCSEEIARRMGFTENEVNNIKYVALLHDIGKIGISDSILSKPGGLTEEEYDVVKSHTIVGADILKDINMLDYASDGARFHHERFDGTGYPSGICGEDIPCIARIISVADAYDAMNSERSYRKKRSHKEIVEEFRNESGHQFDPDIAKIMLQMIKENVVFTEDDFELSTSPDCVEEGSALIKKVLSEYTKEMKIVSQKDNLTGLWNRSYLEQQVNSYLRKPTRRGTMFMLDIDNFKAVNDTYGHIIGDAVLVKFSKILMQMIRDEDIACRIGGDEFILFFRGNMKRQTAESKAREIIDAAECAFRDMNTLEAGAGISIGICVSPKDGSEFLTLYKNADRALYYVKQNGKSGFHFYGGEEDDECISNIDTGTHVDLIYLKKFMEERQFANGVYQVEYEGFKNIYQFVARCIGRTKQNVQTLLFTLEAQNNETLDVIQMQEAMDILKQSIHLSLRRGDVANHFSNSQFIVILMDTTLENGVLVAERIVDNFCSMNDNQKLLVRYDIEEIDKKN